MISVLGKNLKTSVRDGLFDVVVVLFLVQLDSFSAGRAGVGVLGIRSSYFKYVWVWVLSRSAFIFAPFALLFF